MSLSFRRSDNRQDIYDGEELICWFDEELIDKTVVFRLGGKLRGDTAHAFQDEMRALLSVGFSIAIDLEEATYLAPSYMQAILNMHRMIADNSTVEIYIQKMSDASRRALEENGVLKMLPVKEATEK